MADLADVSLLYTMSFRNREGFRSLVLIKLSKLFIRETGLSHLIVKGGFSKSTKIFNVSLAQCMQTKRRPFRYCIIALVGLKDFPLTWSSTDRQT